MIRRQPHVMTAWQSWMSYCIYSSRQHQNQPIFLENETKREIKKQTNKQNTKFISMIEILPYVLRSRQQFWCRKIRDFL